MTTDQTVPVPASDLRELIEAAESDLESWRDAIPADDQYDEQESADGLEALITRARALMSLYVPGQ